MCDTLEVISEIEKYCFEIGFDLLYWLKYLVRLIFLFFIKFKLSMYIVPFSYLTSVLIEILNIYLLLNEIQRMNSRAVKQFKVKM